MQWRKTKTVEEIQLFERRYKLWTGACAFMFFFAFARALAGDVFSTVLNGLCCITFGAVARSYYLRSKQW